MWKKEHTHKGEVRLVDLGDSVVAGVEVSCVLGKRRYAVQPQVVTVDGASEARAQQAGGHTWRTQAKRSKVRVQLKLSGMANSEATPHMLAVQDKTKSRLWKIHHDTLILVTLLFNTNLACKF